LDIVCRNNKLKYLHIKYKSLE